MTCYAGDIVAWIGDAGFRTAVPAGVDRVFEQVLAQPIQALEPWPGAEPTLRVWRRPSLSSGPRKRLTARLKGAH